MNQTMNKYFWFHLIGVKSNKFMIAKSLRKISKNKKSVLTFSNFQAFSSIVKPPDSFIDIVQKRYRGKLIIIPTPIGNMQDISVNIYNKLFEVDVIGCEDTRVTGQLFKLLENRKIADRLYNAFGFSRGQITQYQQSPKEEMHDKEKLFMQYTKMNEKQRRKLLSKMSKDEEQDFKKEYLVFRATKLLGKYEDLLGDTRRNIKDPLYGLENPELSEIQKYIKDTRKKKNRGVLIPLNTYTQTSLFDTILKLLQDYKIGLVTDAGTPCISDPGFKLVRFIREKAPKAEIEVIKGPSSVAVMVTAAYLSCPFDLSRFLSGYFEGFSQILFNKNPLLDYDSFVIFFQNAKRLPKTLAFIEQLYGENERIYIAGEISKRYQRRYNGRVRQLREYLRRGTEHPQGKEKLLGQLSYFLYPKTAQSYTYQLKRTQFQVDPTALAAILNEQIELKSRQIAIVMTRLTNISKNQATKTVNALLHPKKPEPKQRFQLSR